MERRGRGDSSQSGRRARGRGRTYRGRGRGQVQSPATGPTAGPSSPSPTPSMEPPEMPVREEARSPALPTIPSEAEISAPAETVSETIPVVELAAALVLESAAEPASSQAAESAAEPAAEPTQESASGRASSPPAKPTTSPVPESKDKSLEASVAIPSSEDGEKAVKSDAISDSEHRLKYAEATKEELEVPKSELGLWDADMDRRQSFTSPRTPSECGSVSGANRPRRLSTRGGEERSRKVSIGLGGVPKRGYWGGLDDSDSDDSLLAHSRRSSIFMSGPTLMGYNKRQWLILLVFAMVDFVSAMLISIQPQIYPAEAITKNVTTTEYGILFGVFELTVFLVTPAFFNMLSRVRPNLMFNIGIFTIGTSAILFSFLDRIDDKLIFLTFSFILRIIEGIGDASCITAAYAIVASEFPDAVAKTLASLEAFLGLGFIVGPPLAGALFQAGGFMLPFFSFGILLIFSGLLAAFVMPAPTKANNPAGELEKSSGGLMPGFITLLQIPTVALASFSILVASISLGFINSTLYAHLQQFTLSSIAIGGIFILNQGMYSLSAPFWNLLVNRIPEPKYISLLGALLIGVSFVFIGPIAIIPFETILSVTCAGLFVHGFGLGAIYVSGFIVTLRDTTEYGFPDNEATYGLASGLYTSIFTFGSFIGLSCSGIIYDIFGFRWGSVGVVGIDVLLALSIIIFLIIGKKVNTRSRNSSGMQDETDPLLGSPEGQPYPPLQQATPPTLNPLRVSPTYGTSTSYESIV